MWRNVVKLYRLSSSRYGFFRQYSSKSQLEVVILKNLKLQRYNWFEKSKTPLSGLEPLKPNHHDLDEIDVRYKQPNVLYLRTELLLQRLEYLKPSGLLPRQKRKLIKRSPPVLVFTEDHENDKVNYLRGILRTQNEGEVKNVHLLHRCWRMILMPKRELDTRLEFITEELRIAKESALKMLLYLPCFLLHGTNSSSEEFVVMHKYDLPKGYSLDHHTASIYPPIYSTHLEINPRLFTRQSDEELAQKFPKISLGELLDYSYPTHHGRGKTEDLTKFLTEAEYREQRPKYNRIM